MTNEEKLKRQEQAKKRLGRLRQLQVQITKKRDEAYIEALNESLDEFLHKKKEQP